MSNSNYYKRLTGSSIQGDATTVIESEGTLVVTNNGGLRLHDGTTAGGNEIIGGGGGSGWQLTSSTAILRLTSNGIVTLANSGTIVAQDAGGIDIAAGPGPDGYSGLVSNDYNNWMWVDLNGAYVRTGNGYTLKTWTFDQDGRLTVPGEIKGSGTGTDVVIVATNGSNTSTWMFSADGSLTVPLGNTVDANNAYISGPLFRFGNKNETSTFIITVPDATVDNNWGRSILIQGSRSYGDDILPTAPGGNVTIAGGYTWGGTGAAITVFGSGGEGDGYTPSNGGNIDISAGYDLGYSNDPQGNPNLYQGGQIRLNTRTFTGASTSTWIFDTFGSLTLPNGSKIDSAPGQGITLTTDRGTVRFGNSPEFGGPQHFHIMKDVGVYTDLYFGDDFNYMLQPASLGVIIGTNNNNGGGQQQWIFGTDGVLTAPGKINATSGEIDVNTATVGLGGLTVNGPVVFNGPFSFQSTATTQVTGNTGTFYGDVNGVGALYAGIAGSTQLPATVFQSAANVNDYIQNNFQNINHGTMASSEWVATNDTGNDTNNYIDMGIAGHGWDGTQPNSVGTAAGPSDSWVYTQGTVGTNEGGNLILGTIKDGKAVKILAGSTGSSSIVAQFNSTGLILNTSTGITFADGTRQTSAVSSTGTVVFQTLNVTTVSATNITINGQTVTAGINTATVNTLIANSLTNYATQSYVTTRGYLTTVTSVAFATTSGYAQSFNTSTLVSQAVYAQSVVGGNVSTITAGTGTVVSTSTGAVTVWTTPTTWTGGTVSGTATVATFIGTATATSTSTGALQVQGGLGVSGNLYANTVYSGDSYFRGATGNGYIQLSTGGLAYFLSDIVLNGATSNIKGPGGYSVMSVGTPSGSGNTGVKFYSTATVAGTVDATSTASGSLIVQGGASIAKNTYVGGYVVQQTLPAFRVYGNATGIAAVTTLTNAHYIVDYNQGNYLTTSTGIFTAPVAGLYQVNFVIRTNSNASGTIGQAAVVKTFAGTTTNSVQCMVEFGANTTMNHAGAGTVSKLAVGDTLQLKILVGTLNFDANDSWSVAFLG